MESDLQSLFGLHVHSCTHWLRPRNPPPPPEFGLIYEGAIDQPKIDDISFVAPCSNSRDANNSRDAINGQQKLTSFCKFTKKIVKMIKIM